MKNLLLFLFLSIAPFVCFSQNQQGYIYVLDNTEEGPIYYISPYLDCHFPGDHDGIDAKRISLDEQYETYVREHYTLVDFQTTHSDWMEAGRGVFPEKIYNKKLENLPIVVEGSKVVIVSDFVIDCED